MPQHYRRHEAHPLGQLSSYPDSPELRHGTPAAPQLNRTQAQAKSALRARQHLDTHIAWVRAHIGIPGKQQADSRTTFESTLGLIAGSPHTATEGQPARAPGNGTGSCYPTRMAHLGQRLARGEERGHLGYTRSCSPSPYSI